jgi:hypothetical protein
MLHSVALTIVRLDRTPILSLHTIYGLLIYDKAYNVTQNRKALAKPVFCPHTLRVEDFDV